MILPVDKKCSKSSVAFHWKNLPKQSRKKGTVYDEVCLGGRTVFWKGSSEGSGFWIWGWVFCIWFQINVILLNYVFPFFGRDPSVWHFVCFHDNTDILLDVYGGSDVFILMTWTLSSCEIVKLKLMKYIPQHLSIKILKFPVFVFHQSGLSSHTSRSISWSEKTSQIILVRYLIPT